MPPGRPVDARKWSTLALMVQGEVEQAANACLTCHGAGELGTDSGPAGCPDCFGAGKALSQGTKWEWRLREIERTSPQLGREAETDVRWLARELRRNRAALIEILSLCQDAEEGDPTAREIRYKANAALELYDPK
jgi:hypothetical protein